MLEIKKSGIAFNEEEIMDLEQIIIDQDEKAALLFLRKSVYEKIAQSQQRQLKCYLDSSGNQIEMRR